MLSYIVRRLLLMIPTLFGVTVISFLVMQLAPGDPVMARFNGAGGQSTQSPEAFLWQKRELHLDKPWVLNFRWFKNYEPALRIAAHYRALSDEEIAAELATLVDDPQSAVNQERLDFIRSLKIRDLDERLAKPDGREALGPIVARAVMLWCQDVGENGVAAAIDMLGSAPDDRLKVGLVRALSSMVPEPFKYTYSVHPTDEETPAVTAVWKIWWQRNSKKYPEVDSEARRWLSERLVKMSSASALLPVIDEIFNSDYADVAPPFFAQTLLDPKSTLAEKIAASTYLSKIVARPLVTDLPVDAGQDEVAEAVANWIEHYKLNPAAYDPSTLAKIGFVFTDTQYAHMVRRLVTFDFGRSTLKTHDPVSSLIWDGFVASAPLVLMAELIIYFVAVPLGIVCGVFRNSPVDRGISLVLFLLYSIPPFVAGMLFLEFLCYGNYLAVFPMQALHSDNAEQMAFWPWLGDYLWHAFLPVVCLSLFALAAVAMYSRSSILDVINQDYIRTARAKGLAPPTVVMKHGLRNALIPILTLFSSFLPGLLGGSILIEAIFGIHGLGFLGWDSLLQKDYPTLMALLYIEAIVTLVSFLITDLLYVVVDPRITFSGRGRAA